MERKFTDAEIVEALECCMRGIMCRGGCPYDDKCDTWEECTSKLAKDALDLINRQKAEIERLNGCVKTEEEVRTVAESVINSQIAFIKTEAIKGFAERLKQYCAPGGDFGDPCGVLTVTDRWIDHLVKEMTGENNGN